MRKQLIFFIAILLVFLYIANAVVYEALSLMFGIAAPLQLLLLGAALGLLSVSFIGASILGSWFYNWFTRVYYTLSVVWVGFFCYLFLVCIVYGLVVGIFGEPLGSAGITFVSVAVLVSVYGIINAKKIVITKAGVSLPNLPPAWQGRDAVWISDLHLGQLHGPSFARKVVERVNALSPQIIFIGGDLFDGTGAPDSAELIAPLSDLKAPLGVYFITGNHEEFGDNNKFITAVKALGIRVLQDEMVDIEGLQLIGVDHKNASDKEEFKKILTKLAIDTHKPSLLLKHEPKDLDIPEAAGVSLQISGHTHRAQQWPFIYIAQLIYKGYAYGLNRYGAMQVFTSSGVGTWGPPLRVGTNCEIVYMTLNAQ